MADSPRKIALVGTASSGRQAPFDDPSWEIFGVSARANYVTRADRWFELHRLDGEDPRWAAEWRKTLKSWSGDIPILYMIYPEPDLGNVVQYPVDRMIGRFGSFFMTSTFSWMMALAIDEMAPYGTFAPKGSAISISGVDMEYGTEYMQQRAGLRHFIQVAKNLGIDVQVLGTGGMAYDPIPYPMWQDDPLLMKTRAKITEANDSLNVLEGSIRTNREVIASVRGAIGALNRWSEKLGDDPEFVGHINALSKQLDQAVDMSASLSKELVQNEAVLNERRWLLDYLTP